MAEKLMLGMMMSPYEQGEWDMFSLITSAEFGKQRFFIDKNGFVYDRKCHEYMTREKAYENYLSEWEY